jgi:hypothetical protein
MGKVVQVHRREQLLSLDAIDGLADRLAELNKSRRSVPDWLTDTLYNWIDEGGTILTGEGEEIEIYPGIVDDAHGDDGSFRWVSAQRSRKASNAPQRRLRQSMWLRLALYDAAFRIATGRSILGEVDHRGE